MRVPFRVPSIRALLRNPSGALACMSVALGVRHGLQGVALGARHGLQGVVLGARHGLQGVALLTDVVQCRTV